MNSCVLTRYAALLLFSVMVFRLPPAKKRNPVEPPGELGRGAPQRGGGRNGTQKNLKIFSNLFFSGSILCNLQIEGEEKTSEERRK